MARNHGRLLASIWRDPDWTSLSEAAQRTYMLVLSQPQLTLAGSLDTNQRKWSTFASDSTPESIEEALDELARRGFVAIDHDTTELVVRSFTKHDLTVSRVSEAVAKGFWGAWSGITSDHLRQVVVDNCPEDVWERLAATAPPEAVQKPRSAPLEREAPSPPEREGPLPPECPPLTYLLPPPPAAAARSRPPTPVENAEAAAAGTNDERFARAIEILVERTIRQRPPKTNPAGYERSLRSGKAEDHAEHARRILDRQPDITAAALADELEPTTGTNPTQAAFDRNAERDARRATGDFDCRVCEDSGFTFDDEGFAHPCYHRDAS